MEETLRFYVEGNDAEPLGDDAIREATREGKLASTTPIRLVGTRLWAPIDAWATFYSRSRTPTTPMPPTEEDLSHVLPDELAMAPAEVQDMLLYWLHEGEHTFGPVTGEQVRKGFTTGRYVDALVSVVASEPDWYRASAIFAPPQRSSSDAIRITPSHFLSRSAPALSALTMRCPTCLEIIPLATEVCPHCAEPTAAPSAPPSVSVPALASAAPEPSWLKLHWRPLLMVGLLTTLICTGIALRSLAPDPWHALRATASHPATMAGRECSTPCWTGESCQVGECVWRAPSSAHHISSEPLVAGPFKLPKDASDVLPLDNERFAVSLLAGTQITSARTGEALSLVSDAPHSMKLFRVGEAIYATSPSRIYVIHAQTTRLLKTIEVGSPVGALKLGAASRRALVSLPSAHAVAIIATDFHAEIDRIQFGDDDVGPVGVDDTGLRALTTTGKLPRFGAKEPSGNAVYAFDPSRLASQQDRVRSSVSGNPVSVLMAPDGETSYVVARETNELVPLSWQPSGAVRELPRIKTCKEPEQVELVRSDRRALVRCDSGRALEAFDLTTGELLHHVPFNARAVSMAVAPDGTQAVVALASSGRGWAAVVDLSTYTMNLVPLGAEPSSVRMSPDGNAAIVFSLRSSSAWVLK